MLFLARSSVAASQRGHRVSLETGIYPVISGAEGIKR